MQERKQNRQSGFTFAELAFAMVILVIGAAVLVNHLTVNYQTTRTERDRVFAFTKAQAILAEIQSAVDRGAVEAAMDLDVLDDGIGTKFPLTIQTESGALVPADHVVSGNYRRDGSWAWSRRISVQPFLGLDNRNVRFVTVRVFKLDKDGNENAMADLSAVINSAAVAYPTTQVFDVYLLAIENIPGWWVYMDAIKPFVESMITDLESRNPGMSFRTHWITKASFGRNQTYRPYINDTTDSLAPIPDVYHYPGRMPDGSASSYYYVPDNIKGRLNLEGADWNGYDATSNPHPYALADFFNHGMRYPDELALWQQRVDAIEDREQQIADDIANGLTPPDELDDMSKEPTLRLFLEDLNTDPDKYKNALVINLHGELLPAPALRNFSDAAKDPVNHPDWRVVTHPEELRTKNNDGGTTDSLRFRTYAYIDYPQFYTGVDRMDEPMVLEVVGVNLTKGPSAPTELDSDVRLANLPGGVVVSGTDEYPTSWQAAKHVGDSPAVGEMYYEAEYVDEIASGGNPFTRIYLFNTPLSCGQDVNGRGLANTQRARLYGMEYVPCPIDAGPAFTTDLSTIGSGPKNTARWSLELTSNVLTSNMFVDTDGSKYDPSGDVQLQVRTRIASGYGIGDTNWQTSGTTFPAINQPDNLSTTYAWWASSREAVPMTERAQFHGDPRHLPYKDCFAGGDDFADSYNWYHDQLNYTYDARLDFPSISSSRLANRWNSSLWFDLPRYMQLFREGLVESGCVYTTITGFSYYYVGVGNDIGYDSDNGYPNSIPSDLTPHYSTGSGYLNTITGQRRMAMAWATAWPGWTNLWVGFPWLGELYPDAMAADFLDTSSGAPRGNLPAGSSTGYAFQYSGHVAYINSQRQAYGTYLYDNHQRSNTRGCAAFFNIGSASTCFSHLFSSGNGTLTTTGQEVSDNYGMTMPSTAPVSRPYSLSVAGTGGEHWNFAPYASRHTGSNLATYYSHAAGTGSGIVKLVNPSNTSAAYVVVNGIDRTVSAGSSFLAKWAVLSLAHSYFAAGDSSNSLGTPMLARVEIDSPTDITELLDPASIDVLYGIEWTRWDGLPYTQTGSFSASESDLEYVIMYSPDNGETWKYVQDDSDAEPGVRPSTSTYLIADIVSGDESYVWPTPSGTFPEGGYLVRVECYRTGAQVHYSWHMNRIYIQR